MRRKFAIFLLVGIHAAVNGLQRTKQLTTAAALVGRTRCARVRRCYRRRASPGTLPCACALHGACPCALHGPKLFHCARRNLSSHAALRECQSCPDLCQIKDEISESDKSEAKGNIFKFLKSLATQGVTAGRSTDVPENADQKDTTEKSLGAQELLKQLATTAAAVCNTGCPCPFPCGPFGNRAGCNCLPPPCNCPPRCIQYMTGYYYYPYGIWFCGPYNVTGLCCPVRGCCRGGCGCCGAACGPCGPCSCCVVPGVATNDADQDKLPNDSIRSTLDEVAAMSELQQKAQAAQNIMQSYPSMPMMPNMVPSMPQNMPCPPNMPMPNMPMPNMPMPNMPNMPNMPFPNMPNMPMPGVVPNIVPNMPMPNMPMPNMPMPNMPMPNMPMPNMPMPGMPMPGMPNMPMPGMMPNMPMQSMQMHTAPSADQAQDAYTDSSKEKVTDSLPDPAQGSSHSEEGINPVLRTAIYPSDVEAGSMSHHRVRSSSPTSRPSRHDLPKYFDSDSLTSGLQLQENRFSDQNYPGNRMLHSQPKFELEPERFPTIEERRCPVFLSEDDFDFASVPKFKNPYPIHKPLSDHLKSYC